MPENTETEPAKTGVPKKRQVATIIRWLIAVLLVALFGYCLYCRAVWKINVILIILIAGLIALPRKLRKYFYAAITIVVVCIAVWIFLPEDYQGWRPYTFDDEVENLNAKYYVPDEENAGIIYEKLNETFDGLPDFNIPDNDYTFNELSRKKWTAEEYPEYAEWLKNQGAALNMLMQATRLENCHLPVEASLFSYIKLEEPIYVSGRRWSIFLAVAGNNDLAEGHLNEALDKYIAILRLGTHLRQQPSNIYKLVGMAIEALALGQFKQTIVTSNISEHQLDSIDNTLESYKYDWSTNFAEIIDYEKLFAKNMVALFYDIHENGKVRISHDPCRLHRQQMRERISENEPNNINEPLVQDTYEYSKKAAYPNYWRLKLLKVSTLLIRLIIPSNPRLAGEKIDKHFKRYELMLQPDYDWRREPKKLTSYISIYSFNFAALNFDQFLNMAAGMPEEFYHNLYWLATRWQTDIKGTQLLIALRRYKNKYGNWPDHIEELDTLSSEDCLIDPLNNDIFVYKRTGEDFHLYSKGRNGIDEGGKYESEFDPNTFKSTIVYDDRLIWPPKLNSNQEEGTDPND